MSIALTRRLRRYPTELRLSITYDNGPENAEHMRTNKILGTCSYFCEPFHSDERGTVENTIGLVRRFLPKKTNLARFHKFICQRSNTGSITVRENVSDSKPRRRSSMPSVALEG